jgi:hypothetical protein
MLLLFLLQRQRASGWRMSADAGLASDDATLQGRPVFCVLVDQLNCAYNRDDISIALLDLTHRAFAQCFRRLMTQSPCIVFSHTGGESLNTCTNNKMFDLLVN